MWKRAGLRCPSNVIKDLEELPELLTHCSQSWVLGVPLEPGVALLFVFLGWGTRSPPGLPLERKYASQGARGKGRGGGRGTVWA